MLPHQYVSVNAHELIENLMRTTLSIDDDVLVAVRYLAEQEKVALGKMLSELARKGLQKGSEIKQKDGFPVFDVSQSSSPITPEQVKKLDDDI